MADHVFDNIPGGTEAGPIALAVLDALIATLVARGALAPDEVTGILQATLDRFAKDDRAVVKHHAAPFLRKALGERIEKS